MINRSFVWLILALCLLSESIAAETDCSARFSEIPKVSQKPILAAEHFYDTTQIKDPEELVYGFLLKLGSFEKDPISGKTNFVLNPKKVATERARWLEDQPVKVRGQGHSKIDADIAKLIQIKDISPGVKAVSIGLPENWAQISETEFLSSQVYMRFVESTFQMANLRYVETGLIPNEARSAFKMIDDMAEATPGPGNGQLRFHLLFKEEIWNAWADFTTRLLQKIRRLESEPMTQDWIQRIEKLHFELRHPSVPFLPFGGIVERRSTSENSVELMRYFSNRWDDPLDLAGRDRTPPATAELLRLKLIRDIVQSSPPQTRFLAHAHSKAHVRLYQQLGLIPTKKGASARWNRKDVQELESTREAALEGLDRAISFLSRSTSLKSTHQKAQ